jgi:hypothetical protein
MSRHFAAYFAIVGTLAFAPSGAANAGPFNMPHFNMLRPQPHFNMLRPQPHFNMLRPQISMPTSHLSNMPTPHLSNSQNPTHPHIMPGMIPSLHGPTGQPMPQQQSTAGTASGNQFSNVSGGASGGAAPSSFRDASGGANGGTAPSRFRVIEDTRGRFAVVERRSENIVAAGFESYKAASAWIANHV